MRVPLLALVLVGCTNADLKGHYWNIAIQGDADECTGGNAQYNDKLEYRVVFDGNDITMAVATDEFATGSTNGCSIVYESVIWEDTREGFDIRWQIQGSATVNVGGGKSCQPGNGTDWDGTETFEVVSSEDPDISPGCQYTLKLSGKYVEEVK